MLSDDIELKLVFIFFYAAIVYHLANLMKAKGLDIPQFITFSGNGSRLIKVASGGRDLSTLKDFTKIIFKDVYQIEENSALEFRMFSNPKEITCKGGLECTDFSRFEALEKEISNVLIGIDKTSTIPPETLKYNQMQDENIKQYVKNEAISFIDAFFNYNSKFNFFENFGINPKNLEKYRELMKENLVNDLISGIKEKLGEINDNTDVNIEESLFFYPLRGSINKLAYQIYKDNKSN